MKFFIINQFKLKLILRLSISPTTDPNRLARIKKDLLRKFENFRSGVPSSGFGQHELNRESDTGLLFVTLYIINECFIEHPTLICIYRFDFPIQF